MTSTNNFEVSPSAIEGDTSKFEQIYLRITHEYSMWKNCENNADNSKTLLRQLTLKRSIQHEGHNCLLYYAQNSEKIEIPYGIWQQFYTAYAQNVDRNALNDYFQDQKHVLFWKLIPDEHLHILLRNKFHIIQRYLKEYIVGSLQVKHEGIPLEWIEQLYPEILLSKD